MRKKRRVLFVSSSGGHWVQLRRVCPAFEGWSRHYACTDSAYRWILLRTRPHVVVTTGASSGFFAMFFGYFLTKKTIWIDSIANVDEMSLSGQQSRRFARLWITQWPHLARPEGPRYFGSLV